MSDDDGADGEGISDDCEAGDEISGEISDGDDGGEGLFFFFFYLGFFFEEGV